MSQLRAVNLNLIPVLHELLRKKNVTEAARALHMSQPAVSNALARLRHHFDDELLVSRGRGFVLSPLAEQLVSPVEAAVGGIEALLSPREFEPARSRARFRIATADYAALLYGPRLLSRLDEVAPEVSVEYLDVTSQSPRHMANGDVDLIICPSGLDRILLQGFPTAHLCTDEVVGMVDRNSDIAVRISMAELMSRRTILFSPLLDEGVSFVESVLRGCNARPANVVRVTSYTVMPFLVENSSNIALLQRGLAERMALVTRTRLVEPPFAFPRMDVVMAWSRARDGDPAHSWFRELIVDIFRG